MNYFNDKDSYSRSTQFLFWWLYLLNSCINKKSAPIWILSLVLIFIFILNCLKTAIKSIWVYWSPDVCFKLFFITLFGVHFPPWVLFCECVRFCVGISFKNRSRLFVYLFVLSCNITTISNNKCKKGDKQKRVEDEPIYQNSLKI